jgi:DNA mismatch repair ATPase MutS
MALDINARRSLELTERMRDKSKKGTLIWVLDKTSTSMGGRLLRRWINDPLLNVEEINERLDAVKELKDNMMLRGDIQELLKKSAIMITDYSSVFFDFSYMKKPVLFYQFDEKVFREKQYAEGYFNYRETPLGKWADTKENLLMNLDNLLSHKEPFISDEEYGKIFPYNDNKNSERIIPLKSIIVPSGDTTNTGISNADMSIE